MPEIIEKNCHNLLALIEDLISEGSQQDFREAFHRKTIDLVELIENLSGQYRYLAESKDIGFEFIKENISINVFADSRRIEQVFANLLSNAIKYSNKGEEVKVTVAKGKNMAVVKVTDTGQGIAASELPHVFDKYCKISSTPTGGEGSTGLGLSIAKRLVEAHEGSIQVTSKLRAGTEFTVTLPLSTEADPPLGQMVN